MSALQPIYNLPIAYKQGGVISVASNTTLSISSILTRSLADDLDINVGDYFGAQTATTVDSSVVGLNGLDTGTLAASTVYAVYAIADQAGYNPAGFLLSASATSPLLPNGTFPSNYNTFVRIGWAVTNASTQFISMKQSGVGSVVQYTFDAPVRVLNAGTSATQAAVTLTSVVPAVDGIPVVLGCDFSGNAAADTAKLCYSGGTIANSHNVITAQVAGGTAHITPTMVIPAALISGAPKVDYILSTASASLSLWVNGFVDYLL